MEPPFRTRSRRGCSYIRFSSKTQAKAGGIIVATALTLVAQDVRASPRSTDTKVSNERS